MFNEAKKKISALYPNAQGKSPHNFKKITSMRRMFKDNKGNSELVAVIALMAVVLVVAAVVFLPGMEDFFQNTVAKGLKTATENIFSFEG